MTRMEVKSEKELLCGDLSYEIIGAAMEVHNALGPGFTENIYEEALCVELGNRRIKLDRQKAIMVNYKGVNVGDYVLDMIVEGRIILELKATTEHSPIFDAQIYSYLRATGLKLGLLINFGAQKLSHKRIVN
ncbi:GxxExxY protein [Candidatus Poribacteria bacterium]|nr:GxxExxY protein [Candidatus Poribacteria bacterium]